MPRGPTVGVHWLLPLLPTHSFWSWLTLPSVETREMVHVPHHGHVEDGDDACEGRPWSWRFPDVEVVPTSTLLSKSVGEAVLSHIMSLSGNDILLNDTHSAASTTAWACHSSLGGHFFPRLGSRPKEVT